MVALIWIEDGAKDADKGDGWYEAQLTDPLSPWPCTKGEHRSGSSRIRLARCGVPHIHSVHQGELLHASQTSPLLKRLDHANLCFHTLALLSVNAAMFKKESVLNCSPNKS